MYKYILNFQYDGYKFEGFAKQPHKNTVQDKIEEALTKINSNKKVSTFGASRTDSKVHAIDQYLQVTLEKKILSDELNEKLNKLLTGRIYIKNVYMDFGDKINVRHDVLSKTYEYLITLEHNPFLVNYAYQYKGEELDILKMKEVSKEFVGTHDFTPFSNANSSVQNKVRNIYEINVDKDVFLNTKLIKIMIKGNGFLYNMVRIIVGTLIESGKGKVNPQDVRRIFKTKEREPICVCAPPQGLYLKKITYKEDK